MKQKVLNFYGGPGSGKSTTATGVFSQLKQNSINCEYVSEFAKDMAWLLPNNPDSKIMMAQEYIFAKQHLRMRKLYNEVDIIITDSPIILGLAYIKNEFELPSLKNVIVEAYQMYDNCNVFLNRLHDYNPKGRYQTVDEAITLDNTIKSLLETTNIDYTNINSDKNTIDNVLKLLSELKWI